MIFSREQIDEEVADMIEHMPRLDGVAEIADIQLLSKEIVVFVLDYADAWHMCPNCAKSVRDGYECDNPNCKNGWLT